MAKKIWMITGASRGIGAEIVKSDGATIAITYNNAQQADEIVRAIEAEGGRALAIRADSGDGEAVKSAIAYSWAAS